MPRATKLGRLVTYSEKPSLEKLSLKKLHDHSICEFVRSYDKLKTLNLHNHNDMHLGGDTVL